MKSIMKNLILVPILLYFLCSTCSVNELSAASLDWAFDTPPPTYDKAGRHDSHVGSGTRPTGTGTDWSAGPPPAAYSKASKQGNNSFLGFGNITQVVFLDFDSQTNGSDHVYTAAERNAIQAKIEADYSKFNYSFTQTQPTSGSFSTLIFNADSITGGLADKIDFLNLDQTDNAKININSFLGGTGEPPATSQNFINSSATVAAHELGHLAGLRHGDSYGPLGSGVHNPPGTGGYLPTYPGPAGADETTGHLMASPASVGSTLNDLVGDPFFSERSAVKLAFNENGTLVSEQGAAHGSMAAAQALTLASLLVPNTLVSGDHAGIGDFTVDAIHVIPASIGAAGEFDFYSFTGTGGDLLNLEVMSNVFNFANPIDSTVSIFDSGGGLVPYFTSTAFNDDEFETQDSIIIDLRLPADDTYFVRVGTFSGTDTGNYEMFMYAFTPVPEPGTLALISTGILALAARRKRRKMPGGIMGG